MRARESEKTIREVNEKAYSGPTQLRPPCFARRLKQPPRPCGLGIPIFIFSRSLEHANPTSLTDHSMKVHYSDHVRKVASIRVYRPCYWAIMYYFLFYPLQILLFTNAISLV